MVIARSRLAILPQRTRTKTCFWSKPFITFKYLPLQFSFFFPVSWAYISSFSRCFPFCTGVRCAHCCGTRAPHTGQTHQHSLSKTSQKAGTWLGAEFQQGWKHNPSGAGSHSRTLKYNALISRSACSYKSNGFNANRACQ